MVCLDLSKILFMKIVFFFLMVKGFKRVYLFKNKEFDIFVGRKKLLEFEI